MRWGVTCFDTYLSDTDELIIHLHMCKPFKFEAFYSQSQWSLLIPQTQDKDSIALDHSLRNIKIYSGKVNIVFQLTSRIVDSNTEKTNLFISRFLPYWYKKKNTARPNLNACLGKYSSTVQGLKWEWVLKFTAFIC